MTSELQSVVKEVHPEVSFWAANADRAIVEKKKSRAGREVRLALLRRLLGERWWQWWNDEADGKYLRKEVALDDLIDAHIAVWSAERIYRGTAKTLPEDPEVDAKGLRMAIWY